jgi:hypothetical protein
MAATRPRTLADKHIEPQAARKFPSTYTKRKRPGHRSGCYLRLKRILDRLGQISNEIRGFAGTRHTWSGPQRPSDGLSKELL